MFLRERKNKTKTEKVDKDKDKEKEKEKDKDDKNLKKTMKPSAVVQDTLIEEKMDVIEMLQGLNIEIPSNKDRFREHYLNQLEAFFTENRLED
jgi:hypothetical protein